ncbi:hypothetical protein SDJN02_15205, partial [Cucurbita argyrosperma subsp. argyrosperma]
MEQWMGEILGGSLGRRLLMTSKFLPLMTESNPLQGTNAEGRYEDGEIFSIISGATPILQSLKMGRSISVGEELIITGDVYIHPSAKLHPTAKDNAVVINAIVGWKSSIGGKKLGQRIRSIYPFQMRM